MRIMRITRTVIPRVLFSRGLNAGLTPAYEAVVTGGIPHFRKCSLNGHGPDRTHSA